MRLTGIELVAAPALLAFVRDVGAVGEAFGIIADGADLGEGAEEAFVELIEAAAPEAIRVQEKLAAAKAHEIILHNEGSGGVRLRAEPPSAPLAPPARVEQAVHWPTKRRRKEATEAEPRQAAEARKRDVHLRHSMDIVKEARLPLAQTADLAADPEATLRRVGQGRRYRTLQKRVASWRKARTWLLAAFGVPWPRSTAEFLSYLEALATEPCARSVLWSTLAALVFFEKGGGVKPADQISADPQVRSAILEMGVELGAVASRPRRKAPQLPSALVVAWELIVLDTTRPAFQRMYSWWQLVRVWASLRFDDHRGLLPAEMRMVDGDFRAVLTRTKCSGHDKLIEALPVHISGKAFLAEQGWLRAGFDLWVGEGVDRDFLLALPSADGEGLLRIEATYADGLSMTRALHGSTFCTKLIDGVACTDKETKLLDVALMPFWTEHSARATLPSWVGCLAEFPVGWSDLLGRWGATRAEGYIRTHRQRVEKMQQAAAQKFKTAHDPHEALGEKDLFDQVASFLHHKGYTEADIKDQVTRLTVSPLCAMPVDVPEPSPVSSGISDDEMAPVPSASGLIEQTELSSDIPEGTYVVSTAGSARRLHQVGRCWRKPGVDYLSFMVLGSSPPDPSLYKTFCKFCWPAGKVTPEVPAPSAGISSSTSSASSSS